MSDWLHCSDFKKQCKETSYESSSQGVDRIGYIFVIVGNGCFRTGNLTRSEVQRDVIKILEIVDDVVLLEIRGCKISIHIFTKYNSCHCFEEH